MATYYVSNAGSGGNSGLSTGAPKQTYAQATALAGANDTILGNGGDIFRESVTVPANGVTFGAYGTGKPSLRGSDAKNVAGSWTQAPLTPVTISNAKPGVGADDGSWGIGSWTGFDNSANDVTFGDQGGGSFVANNFVRFPGLAIPIGATITAATLTLRSTAGLSGAGTAKRLIYADAADNSAAVATRNDGVGRTKTTANVAWDVSVWTSTTDYTSADIKTVIQEIVNRAGWVSGNAIQLLLIDNGTPNDLFAKFMSRDGSSSTCARLTISYTVGTSHTWYLGSITTDPAVVAHDGVLGSGVVDTQPRKSSLGALASDWDYFYDSGASRLYVYHGTGNPALQCTLLEVGARDHVVELNSHSGTVWNSTDFRHAQGSISALSWAASGTVYQSCDFYQHGGNVLQFNNGSAGGSVLDCTFTDWNLLDLDGGFAVMTIGFSGTPSSLVIASRNVFTLIRQCIGTQVAAFDIDDNSYITEISYNRITHITSTGAGISIYQPAASTGTMVVKYNWIEDIAGIGLNITNLDTYSGAKVLNAYGNTIKTCCRADAVDVEAVRIRAIPAGSTVNFYSNVINGTFDGTFDHEGIGVQGAVGTVKIDHNTVVNCDDGVKFKTTANTGVSLRNNIFKGNRLYGINQAVSTTFTARGYNCTQGNTSGNYTGLSATTGDITTDPRFTNFAGADFSLLAGSPCIHAGIDAGITTDVAGHRVSSPPDIGAYAFGGRLNPPAWSRPAWAAPSWSTPSWR